MKVVNDPFAFFRLSIRDHVEMEHLLNDYNLCPLRLHHLVHTTVFVLVYHLDLVKFGCNQVLPFWVNCLNYFYFQIKEWNLLTL